MKRFSVVADRDSALDPHDAVAAPAAAQKSRKSQVERRRESMTQIMNTAEALFAEEGLNGVTLNRIAEEAGVDASLLRYYFGDKEQLFQAVFRRRGPELNQARLKAMADYRESAGKNLKLEGVIDALVRPGFLKMCEDEGWRNYMAIVSYVNASRGPMQVLMAETFHYVSREFIADLRRIYPNVAEEEIYWAYLFLSGALTYSISGTGRIDVLSEGKISMSDSMAILERFPIAMAGIIRGICERPDAARPPRARRAERAKDAKR
jgi:AcrR family transcriptional regulator